MTSKQSRLSVGDVFFSVDHLQRHVITPRLIRDTFTTADPLAAIFCRELVVNVSWACRERVINLSGTRWITRICRMKDVIIKPKPHECVLWGSRNTRVARKPPRPQVKGVFRPMTTTSVFISAPSEITRVWVYIYAMPQKLAKITFKFWNSTRQSRHDVTMKLCRRSHEITSIQRHSGHPPDTTWDTTARSPDTTGPILLVFLRNILRWW
jgi:hypothetical protein